jgi:uncharacterized protein (TIGR01244 family)
MSDRFIPLAEGFWVSPQISPGDLETAKSMGVGLVINNRPDREEAGQPAGADIAAKAKTLGLSYVAIPVGPAGIGPAELDAFDQAIAAAEGGVLAFCRSGTRSTVLRALALARAGAAPDALIDEAANAGYNIAGQRAAMAALGKR